MVQEAESACTRLENHDWSLTWYSLGACEGENRCPAIGRKIFPNPINLMQTLLSRSSRPVCDLIQGELAQVVQSLMDCVEREIRRISFFRS